MVLKNLNNIPTVTVGADGWGPGASLSDSASYVHIHDILTWERVSRTRIEKQSRMTCPDGGRPRSSIKLSSSDIFNC